MSYFRITLTRSGIGMPKRTQGVLKALGLRHRMATVFYPVTPEVAGQIMRVKELVSVQEVDKALTKSEVRAERRPDPGFYLESATPRSDEAVQDRGRGNDEIWKYGGFNMVRDGTGKGPMSQWSL
ncbi:54S ribosomal protein L33, mitochondrial [Lachnellula occidentalis]|uniref:Large ribosomal subunit protein uL30m n=1 Tax=Lachnellula occidentalis TaxID=215460 RepID=A0A8H8S750_9HELO|nr:54S ribosomal protein L33, mitochondrial [Lachnellula occidentalis]